MHKPGVLLRIIRLDISQKHKEKEIHIKKIKINIKKKKNRPRGCVRGLFLSLTCAYLCIRRGSPGIAIPGVAGEYAE